jgi:hypothetical protein
LARVLIAGDEEVKAVRLLKEAIEELPMDYSLLNCQATFLQSKDNLEWAEPLAQRAVIAAPSEFGTWSKLAEIYVGLEKWELALLTLNSCPMFTYTDKDAPRMPEPARVMLPVLSNTALDEIDESIQGYDTEMVHPNLRKLSAAGYKGTFLKAYSLLTDITSKIGWDQLLRIRSQVFVMEEEYRSEKSQPGTGRNTGQTPGRNLSTTALRAPSPEVNGIGDGEGATKLTGEDSKVEKSDEDNNSAESDLDNSIEKPEHTVASTVVKSGSEDVRCGSYPFDNELCCVERSLNIHSLILSIQITPISSTSGSVSVGSTTSLWSCTKTSESTQSGERTWPVLTKLPPSPQPRPQSTLLSTAKAQKNGRFLESFQSACTIFQKLSKPIRAVCACDSALRLCEQL